jgi:hypothetical protein
MAKVITGLFENGTQAAAAISTLEMKGIPSNDISLVASEGFDKDSFGIEQSTKLPEGAAIGAGTGGAIGALILGMTAVGTIATGGVGLLAAGPIVAALAGAGAGAAAGGVIGGSIGAFIPEDEVKFYEEAIEKGSVLVGVEYKDKDQKKMIEESFENHDAARVATA